MEGKTLERFKRWAMATPPPREPSSSEPALSRLGKQVPRAPLEEGLSLGRSMNNTLSQKIMPATDCQGYLEITQVY